MSLYQKREADIVAERRERQSERTQQIADTAIELYDRIEQVENLHAPVLLSRATGLSYCRECSDYYAGRTVMHPCPTLKILLAD